MGTRMDDSGPVSMIAASGPPPQSSCCNVQRVFWTLTAARPSTKQSVTTHAQSMSRHALRCTSREEIWAWLMYSRRS